MNNGKISRIHFAALVIGLLALSAAGSPLLAQGFSLGADFVSRYVWRGTDFGESASIQPALSFARNGFEIGTWASYGMDPEAAGVNEHDLWIGYTVDLPQAGSVSFGATDYYFPSPDGLGFFEFDGDGEGAHWIEPYVTYTAPGRIPVSVYAGMFVHNDPDNSLYVEASLPLEVDGVELGFTAGAIAGESALYGTDAAALVNLAFSVSKSVPVTDRFSLPISVVYILNPDAERSYLVFGLSL